MKPSGPLGSVKKERSLVIQLISNYRELSVSHTVLARKLQICISGVGWVVERGEFIGKSENFMLVN